MLAEGGSEATQSSGARRARPPDLRLAGTAVGVWLAALGALHGSVRSAVGVAATAAMLGTLLAGSPRLRSIVDRRTGGWVSGWVMIGVCVGVASGGAATAARLSVRDAPPLTALARERALVAVEVVVRDDPRAVTGTPSRPTWLIEADLIRLRRMPDGPWVVVGAR